MSLFPTALVSPLFVSVFENVFLNESIVSDPYSMFSTQSHKLNKLFAMFKSCIPNPEKFGFRFKSLSNIDLSLASKSKFIPIDNIKPSACSVSELYPPEPPRCFPFNPAHNNFKPNPASLNNLNIGVSLGPIPSISPPGTSIPSADAAIKEFPVSLPFKKEDESFRADPTEFIIPFSSVEFNPKLPKPTEFIRCFDFWSVDIFRFCLLLPGVSMNFIKVLADFPPK